MKHVLKSVEGGVAVLETKITFAPVDDVVDTVQGKSKIEFFEAEITVLATFELKNGILKTVEGTTEITSHTEKTSNSDSKDDAAPVKEIMTTRSKATAIAEKIE